MPPGGAASGNRPEASSAATSCGGTSGSAAAAASTTAALPSTSRGAAGACHSVRMLLLAVDASRPGGIDCIIRVANRNMWLSSCAAYSPCYPRRLQTSEHARWVSAGMQRSSRRRSSLHDARPCQLDWQSQTHLQQGERSLCCFSNGGSPLRGCRQAVAFPLQEAGR